MLMEYTMANYARRQTDDGSVDSICLFCFLTVGNAKTEEELETMEASHNCYLKKTPPASPFSYLSGKKL